MLISLISSSATTTQVLNPVLSSRSTSASSTATKASTSTAPASTASATTASPAKTSRSGSSSGGGGGSAAVQETNQATGFSTTVAGKQYSGSVADSDGTYTASISNLSGATASGSSAQAAEDNLNARIDELV